jgi:hypothetical protein
MRERLSVNQSAKLLCGVYHRWKYLGQTMETNMMQNNENALWYLFLRKDPLRA